MDAEIRDAPSPGNVFLEGASHDCGMYLCLFIFCTFSWDSGIFPVVLNLVVQSAGKDVWLLTFSQEVGTPLAHLKMLSGLHKIRVT